MLRLTASVLTMMTSFIISILIGSIIIPILKHDHIDQRLSVYLSETHQDKKDTPTFGGVIFISSTLITMLLLLLFNKITITNTLIIIVFTFLYYFMLDNEPLLWIHTFNIRANIGWFYGLFILFVLVASSNAVNLKKGLDGLATGLSIIAFITFGILSFNSGWLNGYEDIGLFAFSLVGSLLGFLIFNSHPAKIFMGDSGSLALGATLGAFAILTRHELLLIIIGIVFVIETLSCIIQR